MIAAQGDPSASIQILVRRPDEIDVGKVIPIEGDNTLPLLAKCLIAAIEARQIPATTRQRHLLSDICTTFSQFIPDSAAPGPAAPAE